MSRNPRTVSFATKINILKENIPAAFIGFIFTLVGTTLFFVFLSIEDDTPKVDYELISLEGKETLAQITDIEIQYNTRVNGVHPTIISYKYVDNGKEVHTKFKTLAERKVRLLKIGAEIPIKIVDGQSIIKDLKPFNAAYLKYIPLIITIIGVPFLIFAIYKFQRKLQLYKYGDISFGEILSMIHKGGFRKSRTKRGITVQYRYKTTKGKSIIGKALIYDFAILKDKKEGDFLPIFISTEEEEKSCMIPKVEAYRNDWDVEFK